MSIYFKLNSTHRLIFQQAAEELLKKLRSLDLKNDDQSILHSYLDKGRFSSINDWFTKQSEYCEKQRFHVEQHRAQLTDNCSIFLHKINRVADRPDLKKKADEALKKFHETEDKAYLFLYRKLIREYRSILLNCYRKIKQIINVKYLGNSLNVFVDLRSKYRVLIKMISRNTDDEAPSVKNKFYAFNLFLTLIKTSNGYSNYISYYHRPRVALN